MFSDLDTFAERLQILDPESDDFVLQVDVLVEDLDPGLGAAVAPSILAYFEAHPNSDMGAPGTLIHYLESFYPSYVDALMESLSRKPSLNAVLMINRILNSPDIASRLRAELTRALEAAALSAAHDVVRDLADKYYRRHTSHP